MEKEKNLVVPRILAYSIDFIASFIFLIIPLIFLIIGMALFTPEMDVEAVTSFYVTVILFILMFIYFLFFEVKYSTTPGKKLFDLGVKKDSDEKITFKDSFIRNISKIRPELVAIDFVVGMLLKLSTKYRLLDVVAKTEVVPIPPGRRGHSYTKREASTIRVYRIVLSCIGVFFLGMMLIGYIWNILASYG